MAFQVVPDYFQTQLTLEEFCCQRIRPTEYVWKSATDEKSAIWYDGLNKQNQRIVKRN